MAKALCEITLGIDVSKHELVICDFNSDALLRLPNQTDHISAWIQSLHAPARIAVEPTSCYHLELVSLAHRHGLTVYLVNPRQLAHYRKAISQRHKSDPDDARLLARYLAHEASQLRVFQPPSPQAQQLWALLKRRRAIVRARQQLQQCLAHCELSAKALFTQFARLLARIDQRLNALVQRLGWSAHVRRCLSIPGIGPLNAIALVAAFHRGSFASADAFVAFIGLDVRRHESGAFKGRRKLSKHGDSEIRRLLYCASQPARREPRFERYYQAQIDKGLPKTAARIILARKLARIAFAMICNEQNFRSSTQHA